MKKVLKDWFINLELALIVGIFITMLLVIFSPFYMNTAFLIEPIANVTIPQVYKLIGLFIVPTMISIIFYTIIFFIKKK